MSELILVLDAGTTSTRAMLFTPAGELRGVEQAELTQHYPRPGWVEHDAAEIWTKTRDCACTLADRAGGAGRIAAIGIANQRETVVAWDRRTREPLARAIVWQDRRTADFCTSLREAGHQDRVRSQTGLLLDPYFSATKMRWLLDHMPAVAEAATAGRLAFGTIESWLAFNLTGMHLSDAGNASRTLLLALSGSNWDESLCELFGVPRKTLPEIVDSAGRFGSTRIFGAPVPVCGLAGDQQAATFGQTAFDAGEAKNTYGTGAFLLLNTGDKRVDSKNGLLTTVACDAAGQPAYALEGAIFIAGAAVQWLRDELGIVEDAAETEGLARSLQSNDGVYLVPAFVGLGAPHWEAEARGMLVGLTRGSGRAHFARAALESMAYATYDVLHAMVEDSGLLATEFAVDGGATHNDWLVQFQADLIGVPVRRPQIIDTTAMGAAGLAGIAAGVWRDAHAFRGAIEEPDVFTPHVDRAERDALLKGWHRAVNAALVWARNEA